MIPTTQSIKYPNPKVGEIIDLLTGKKVQQDINYIIDRLTKYEDKGYYIRIDICYYITVEWPTTLVYCKYTTERGDSLCNYATELRHPETYPDLIETAYMFLRNRRLCYRVSIDHGEFYRNGDVYNDMLDRLCDRLPLLHSFASSILLSTNVGL